VADLEYSSRNRSLTGMQQKQSIKNEFFIVLYQLNNMASDCLPFIDDPPAVSTHLRQRTRQSLTPGIWSIPEMYSLEEGDLPG
jgi:hypothetical protein